MPVKRIPGQSFNVAERLDPYFLFELYGADQFRAVLNCFGVPRLQEALQVVQDRHPNALPSGKRTKEALVAFLAKQIAAIKVLGIPHARWKALFGCAYGFGVLDATVTGGSAPDDLIGPIWWEASPTGTGKYYPGSVACESHHIKATSPTATMNATRYAETVQNRMVLLDPEAADLAPCVPG